MRNSSPLRYKPFRSNYGDEEIRVLIEEYGELTHQRHKALVGVRLMDIDRAVSLLPQKYKEAVLLCGIVGLTVRTAGKLLDVPTTSMFRRYIRGLEEVEKRLNGRL